MLHLHAENHISERRQSCSTRALPAGTSRKAWEDPLCAPPGLPQAGRSTVGANTWRLTVSQLLPTLLPPTSSSKTHPPHPAHLHHTRSPTFLLGCCSLLPALSSSPCSGSEALLMGKGLWIESDALVTLILSLHSIYIQPRKTAGLRHAVWQQDSPGCLPAGEVTGSSAGLAHLWDWSMLLQSVVGRRAMSSLAMAAHRDRQSYTRSAHPINQGNSSCCQPSPKPSAKQRRWSAGLPLTLALRSLLVP